jgi:antitoxin component of MazEF toxin-antitoxin module
LERAWRPEPVSLILQLEARQDVRRGAAHRGGQSAACCPELALRSAQVLLSEQAWRSGQQALPGALREQQMPEALLSAQAQAVPKDRPQEAAEVSVRAAAERERAVVWEPDEPRAASEAEVWVRAAAEPRRAAVPGAWEPGVPRAVQEAAHAVAEPQPGAAKAVSGPQAAVGAVAVPDGPQVAAEVAAELLGAAVRQPAEVPRADGAVQLRAAVRPGARAPQAARPLAVPSAAASVFRQGRSLVAAPARRRAAARLAHAMRSLRIASRSEPWWQAARNEGWSCGELPRKVL